METTITLYVDGHRRELTVDTRTTLLDALRDRLGEYSPKKGCDHGQCGACTVLLEGERILPCLALAVAHDGAHVTTAAGLARDEQGAHPLARAFLEHDAFQCGYCTPGQLCSAVGMLSELRAGMPSHATAPGAEVEADAAEIRERMSGNLCRCGAYTAIVEAVQEVAR